jgi:hypothetical protein
MMGDLLGSLVRGGQKRTILCVNEVGCYTYPFLYSQTHYNYQIQYLLSSLFIQKIHYHNSGITTKITIFSILYDQNSRTHYNWYRRHEITSIVEELLPFNFENVMGTVERNKSHKPGKEDLGPCIVAKDGGG